ncbi:MAG: hypothetical protein L6R30_18215 [Thermoanaerobaculia bacterium]|nr:hypothetical protein [Thermoanaerobaculia bacterium]MCK6684341.1 hypothetical protein [Thermoanaerobaculia bacterium]
MPRFSEVFPETGVEGDASPNPWMLVRRETYNMALLHEPQGLTLDFDSPLVDVHELRDQEAVARFATAVLAPVWRGNKTAAEWIALGTANLRQHLADWLASAAAARALLVAVVPKRLGSGSVRAVDAQKAVRATLDFTVKEHRQYSVAFRFVEWGQGRRGRTSRNASELRLLLSRVNHIYLPQTNVTFRQGSIGTVRIQSDLGDSFLMSRHPLPPNAHERHILPSRDAAAALTVFFVSEAGSLYHEAHGVDLDAIYVHRLRILVIEDDLAARDEFVLAHELGHFLQSRNGVGPGQQHTAGPGGARHLMFADSSRLLGARISKLMANRMNP